MYNIMCNLISKEFLTGLKGIENLCILSPHDDDNTTLFYT